MPAQVLHHPAAHGRADQRAEQAGNGDEAHDPHQLRARIRLKHHQPPHRQHQGAAQPLNHAGADQLIEGAGQRAQQRAEAEQEDGTEEDFLGAEAGNAVLRIVPSSDCMKNAMATTHGNQRNVSGLRTGRAGIRPRRVKSQRFRRCRRRHGASGSDGAQGYNVNVSVLTSAPGNRFDAVWRWSYVLADTSHSRSTVSASSCEPSRL